MKEAWYEVAYDEQEEAEEPIWDKVPEDRRERVRASWNARRPWVRHVEFWWGPQIALLSHPKYGRRNIVVAPEPRTAAA